MSYIKIRFKAAAVVAVAPAEKNKILFFFILRKFLFIAIVVTQFLFCRRDKKQHDLLSLCITFFLLLLRKINEIKSKKLTHFKIEMMKKRRLAFNGP